MGRWYHDDVAFKAASISNNAKKGKDFLEDESTVALKGVEPTSVHPKFATIFTDVAIMKADLRAVKASQN